jgi:hypothetical protein
MLAGLPGRDRPVSFGMLWLWYHAIVAVRKDQMQPSDRVCTQQMRMGKEQAAPILVFYATTVFRRHDRTERQRISGF